MASAMFRSAYGYHVQGHDDPFFKGAKEAIEHLFSAHMYTSKAEVDVSRPLERSMGLRL
jgi:hypothetical protein